MANISKNHSDLMILLFLITFLCSNFVSSFGFGSPSIAPSQIPYADHCSSFVPEPSIQNESPSFVQTRLYYVEHIGYHTSQASSSSTFNSLVFKLSQVYQSGTVQALYRVEASLVLESRYLTYRSRSYYQGPAYIGRQSSSKSSTSTLWLQGFWSESSGKMCLVGGVRPYRRNDLYRFPVSLKLYNIKNSSNLTSPVTGTLESLMSSDVKSPYYFAPISFILFTRSNYEYTLAYEELRNKSVFGAEFDISPGLPLDSFSIDLAVKIFLRTLELKYSGRCANASFSKKCSPFGDFVGGLPSAVQFRRIEISTDKQIKLRVLIRFSTGASDSVWDYATLDPNTTLVGEGIWDKKKNQLFVVACRFLNATASWAEARIGDCSMRLSLRFPAVWSIGHTSSVVGHIWSSKNETELGYFYKIGFQSSENLLAGSIGMKYEYTKINKAKKWCPMNLPGNSKRNVYPAVFSSDMRFDIFCKRAKRNCSRGYANPLTVGNQFCDRLSHIKHSSKWNSGSADASEENVRHLRASNVSYEIGVTLSHKSSQSSPSFESWVISAEGIYDSQTGSLCMVGCRNLNSSFFEPSSNDKAFDCEILFRFQFPPKDSSKNSGFIRGIIESKREKSDPLYFEHLDVSSAAYVLSEAEKSIWNADLEIIMSILFDVLSCIFVAAQLIHLRRNPIALPFVSLGMVAALVLGHATALLVDLNSMVVLSSNSRDVLLGSGRWLEARGLAQGAAALVLLLLQARLLQRAWSGRFFSDDSVVQNRLCIAEKEAVLVSLPLCFGAALFSVAFAWKTRNNDPVVLSTEFLAKFSENPILAALKSYADIVSDGFLFPQILLNVFVDSSEQALCFSFYIGTTLVRALPHVYNLYKAQNSGFKLVSTVWDVINPLVSLLFAALIYLQYKFGGRCLLPHRFRESIVYEKVPYVAEIET